VCIRYNPFMAITFYWGSGSPDSWRILLALEHKGLPYESHLLHFDKQEHQSPPMLKMNPRGRLPVLKDGDYVVFESVAVLYYLDVKYPATPIFGLTPEEAGVIMRVICEFQIYAEPALSRIVNAIFEGGVADALEELTDAMHVVGREARTIEGRLSKEQWIVGAQYSAADMVIFPWIQLLRRALNRSAAAELGARFLPMERNYPALARWIGRIESLPGYDRTYPPHWRETAAHATLPTPATPATPSTPSTPARPVAPET
jgi:glutathione S-transferase